MAPFGKNFLKSRLKNRTAKKEVESVGKEIQVWVSQEEKVVSGLTRYTTCADVINALLEDQKASSGDKRVSFGDSKQYCLIERWRGFERALPPLTRMTKLLRTWGQEKTFVQFVLVKTDAYVRNAAWMSSETNLTAAKEKRWDQGPAQYMKSLPVHKQKKMVRKAFRKLEKMKHEPVQQDKNNMESLIQLVISQDLTIRQQIRKMRELDIAIEKNELEVCMGWTESAEENTDKETCYSEQPGDYQLQEYIYTNDGVLQLEEELEQHKQLIKVLTNEIEEEIKSICLKDFDDTEKAAGNSEWEYKDDTSVEGLKDELEDSMKKGLAVHMNLLEIQKQLQYNEVIMQSKMRECELLAGQLSTLHIADNVDHLCSLSFKDMKKGSVGQNRLPKTMSKTDVNDTDSDTGISSTHSQDSLSPCLEISAPPI
ncbi:ras association domain-containing protein 9 [Erpetoichthys calabaricus]|uniref:Ras association domain family member 9 n=1 Tax=Erpetoichthys calabaricus TaxID=27687 RepID=A0A8C4XA45_ERPCA|nr:ras association domain-containing protein 9 [Erpetoichthys calabaricus]